MLLSPINLEIWISLWIWPQEPIICTASVNGHRQIMIIIWQFLLTSWSNLTKSTTAISPTSLPRPWPKRTWATVKELQREMLMSISSITSLAIWSWSPLWVWLTGSLIILSTCSKWNHKTWDFWIRSDLKTLSIRNQESRTSSTSQESFPKRIGKWLCCPTRNTLGFSHRTKTMIPATSRTGVSDDYLFSSLSMTFPFLHY